MRPASFQVYGSTALLFACAGGHAEVVKALLDAEPKADIEAKDNVGVLSMYLHSSQALNFVIRYLAFLLIVKAIHLHAPHLFSGWPYGPYAGVWRRSYRGRQGVIGSQAQGQHRGQEQCGCVVLAFIPLGLSLIHI